MSNEEIKANLCYYDPENPNNTLDAYDKEDRPQPRNECYCDNCFYGRDKLAVQILETRRERDQALEDLKVLRFSKMGDPLLEITFRNLISERDELKCKIKELDQALKASAELLCFFFQQSGITKEDLKERLEAVK